MKILEVKNLHVNVGDKEILKGIDLDIFEGKVHVIMGPNGAGKSTLTNSIMAHPNYEVTKGDIFFKGENINELRADERAKLGMFMSFQNPEEVPGVTVSNFIRASRMSITGEKESVIEFQRELEEKMESLTMDASYAQRYLNVGFSGGEKKKTEILQMVMLNPALVMLDETDSGLDIDATKIVFEGVQKLKTKDTALLIITHYDKVLEYLKPDFVHVLMNGKIVKSGGIEIVEAIEKDGYGKMKEELGL